MIDDGATTPSLDLRIAQRRRHLKQRQVNTWVQLALLIWTIAFLDPISLFRTTGPGFGSSRLEQISSSIQAGSFLNQALVLSLAGVGLVFLKDGASWLFRARSRPAAFLVAYCLWAGTTLAWSVDPQLTARRVGELVLIVIACVGLGAGFYGTREDGKWRFMRDMWIVGAVAMLSVWIPALLRGDLAVLSPEWSLIRVGVATRFGLPIGFALLGAIHARLSGLWLGRVSNRALDLYIVFASLTLISLRKRTLLAGILLMGALLVVWMIGSVRRRNVLAKGIIAGAAVFMLASVAGADPIEGLAVPVLTRGEDIEKLTSLTGRIPLWTHLFEVYGLQSPFTGAGYGAFWRPDTLASVWDEVGWPATTAHNGLIEEFLATGVVGMALLIGFWGVSLRQLLRSAKRDASGDSVAKVLATWIGVLAVTSLASTTFQDWDELVVIMPVAGVLAWSVWTELERRSAAHSVQALS